MYCVKCGRDTTDERVFCDRCLENMERYPVKPGTPVHLPHRKEASGKRTPVRKRTVSPEEQVLALKKNLRRSRICVLVLFLILSLASVLLVREIASSDAPIIGQNYIIDTTRTAD